MALANTLTGLIPTLFSAMDVVSRELVGMIPSVTINADASRVALNQPLRVRITPKLTSVNITPSMTPPTPDSVPITFVEMSVTKSKAVQIPWSGEEQQSLSGAGSGIQSVSQDQVAQGLRTLTNEIEADLGAAGALFASRAFGTAGTAPFGGGVNATVNDSAQVRKILDDNGAPLGDRQLIINTSAGVNLRTVPNLIKANEAATAGTLRQGTLFELHGFNIRESAGIASPAKGTGSAYTTNAAGYAVGATLITLITGTGTILAGDRIIFTGDPNVYVVETGLAAPGPITIAKPGLRQAIPTSATGVAVQNVAALNLAFHRSAIILMARSPYLPGGRDMALERMTIVDPLTGMPFEFAIYQGYHAQFLEVSMSWGVKGIKQEHTAILLG
jgi:hypothetical protein